VAKSAVDVISPAFEHTRKQLVEPFRWTQWWRLAVLGLATGEMSATGGCGGWNRFGGTPKPDASHGPVDIGKVLHGIDPALIVTLLLVAIGAALVLMVVWIYVSSISRFVLFEAVLRKYCDSLSAGWRRAEDVGMNFFWWQLGFAIVKIVVAGILFIPLLIPVLAVMRSHRHPGPEMLLAFLPVIAVFAMFNFITLLITVLAKDFVVPLMAIDGMGVLAGWRRLLGMIAAEKARYAGYIAMKALLTIAAAIVFAILSFIAAMFVVVPAAILGVLVWIVLKGAGTGLNAFTITVAIFAVAAVIGILLCVIALVSVPVTVFFPAYAIYFFAERYPALSARLYSPTAPSPVTPPSPMAPPIPAG
jgi:hypothetical protein